MKRIRQLLLLFVLALAALGCRSAYYGTLELLGTHKRDILVDRVDKARGAQQAAQEQIVDTLGAFQELVGTDGGNLGRLYERLRRHHVRAEERAALVRQRIDSIESVARDLFSEWQYELDTIQDDGLRARSATLLGQTQASYGELLGKLHAASQRMEVVLATFRDHVIFLKHSLNAQAVDALRETRARIESDVDELVREMQESILEAETFIRGMRQGSGEAEA